MHLPSAVFVLALAAGVIAQSPRDPRVLTVLAEAHVDAKISPDGTLVAFKGPNKIGVVAWSGGSEATLASGTNLGEFLWAPTSTGIYFVDGTALKYVARSGGMATTVAALAGQQHRISAVTNNDRTLYGSRYNPTTATYYIFTVPTNGSASPTDIITSQDVVEHVRLSPDNQSILYRSSNPAPFSPREYWLANANGTNRVSLTGMAIQGNLEDADWIDNANIVLNMLSPTSNRTQLAALSTSNATPRFLTDGNATRRRSSVSASRSWVVCEAQNGSGFVPAVLPPGGAGLVPLVNAPVYMFNGAPSIDAAGRRVAWAGLVSGSGNFSHVHAVELDRELVIAPRAEINTNFTVALPVQLNELGAAILSVGPGGPFPIPGIRYELLLDPTVLIPVLTGTGNGSAPLQVSIPVPNDPSMTGAEFSFQGLRVLGGNAEFTRPAGIRVF